MYLGPVLYGAATSSMASAGSAKTDKVRLIGVGGVRSVCESSFDFLHTEVVHYLAQQIAKQDKQYDKQDTTHATQRCARIPH